MNTNDIQLSFQDTPQLWSALRPNEYDGAPDGRSAIGHGRTPVEALAAMLEDELDLEELRESRRLKVARD